MPWPDRSHPDDVSGAMPVNVFHKSTLTVARQYAFMEYENSLELEKVLEELGVTMAEMSRKLKKSDPTFARCVRGEQLLMVAPWTWFEAIDEVAPDDPEKARQLAFALKKVHLERRAQKAKSKVRAAELSSIYLEDDFEKSDDRRISARSDREAHGG